MPVPIDEAPSTGVSLPSAPAPSQPAEVTAPPVREVGGPSHPDPTRFGDWELRGRCIDF